MAHSDSHVLINAFDYLELKPVSDVVPVFKEAKILEKSECEGLYCSEPAYIPVRNLLKSVLMHSIEILYAFITHILSCILVNLHQGITIVHSGSARYETGMAGGTVMML